MADRAVVKPIQCKIGDAITVDSCLDETHSLDNEVTDHEVEEGFNITDHSRPKPDVVTLRCFVTNTPNSLEQMKLAVNEGSSGESTDEIKAVPGRGNDIFKKLKKLRDTGELVTLVTTLKTYTATSTEGMIVQSISIPRTASTFNGLEFSVTFKQIRIVKNKQTRDTQSKDTRTGQKNKTGSQPTKKTDEAPEKEKSIGAAAADSMAGADNSTISAVGRAIGGIR